MTLIRFVNGLVDIQQKGQYAISISSLAEKIGLPTFFVELRHDATHNQLPSLPVLLNSVQTALNWLEINYWNKIMENVLDTRYIHDNIFFLAISLDTILICVSENIRMLSEEKLIPWNR
jgi:hypothetical protein